MYKIPAIDDRLKDFAKSIGCKWIGAVQIAPKPLCKKLDCHNNVLNYINTYGGTQKIGYYFVEDTQSMVVEAILHSVVERNNSLLDITPFDDSREYNIIGLTDETAVAKLKSHIIQQFSLLHK